MSRPLANRYLLWLDLEMTGLDPEKDFILEAAWFLTTLKATSDNLGDRSTIAHDVPARNQVADYVMPLPLDCSMVGIVAAMHAKNGLLVDCCKQGNVSSTSDAYKLHLSQLSHSLLAVIGLAGDDSEVIIAGNTIHCDRGFIKRWLPEVNARLHYRHFDVSAIRMGLEARGHVFAERAKEDETHRAVDDVIASIELSNLCSSKMFFP